MPQRLTGIIAGILGLIAIPGDWGSAQAQAPAVDNPLVTDLSSHLIAITSNFVGTDLLLFGSIEQAGDVIVVLRGPTGPVNVRQKERAFGIWLNRQTVRFEDVPSFYAVVTDKPLKEIASRSLLARLGIGVDNLNFHTTDARDNAALAQFRQAVVRNKLREGLYQEQAGELSFLGRKLFRTRISFPAIVPVGTYQAEVYLMRGDRVIAAQAAPLFIDKQGFGQAVYEFAHQWPWLYGLAAVAAAVTAGWVAATVFPKT
jgi:uncharacterized protein (TIGR02186 family)